MTFSNIKETISKPEKWFLLNKIFHLSMQNFLDPLGIFYLFHKIFFIIICNLFIFRVKNWNILFFICVKKISMNQIIIMKPRIIHKYTHNITHNTSARQKNLCENGRKQDQRWFFNKKILSKCKHAENAEPQFTLFLLPFVI